MHAKFGTVDKAKWHVTRQISCKLHKNCSSEFVEDVAFVSFVFLCFSNTYTNMYTARVMLSADISVHAD